MADNPLEVISPRPHAPGASQALGEIASDLTGLIQGEVRFAPHDRMLYATDASIYQVEPLGVVIPRTIDDAVKVVAYCGQRGLPILPRGGGTSLAGQAVSKAVVIDFSACCRRLLGIDEVSRTATVEPGLVLDELNRAAAGCGLMFGPDVATSTHATLGGMIGNNSAGAHSILYGRTVEHLEAVDLILADGSRLFLQRGAAQRDERVRDLTRSVAEVVMPLVGEIRRRWPRTLRRVNGYNLDLLIDQIEAGAAGQLDQVNLAHLVCGAEGTLGVVAGARVRLVQMPQHKGLAIVAFASLSEALAALIGILKTQPAAVELIDDVIIKLAAGNVTCRRALSLLPATDLKGGAVLYVEYFADDAGAIDEKLAALESSMPGTPLKKLTEPGQMADAWTLRKSGEPLLHGVPGPRKPVAFVEDTAVDPARLAEFVQAFDRLVAKHGTTAAYYAHASVGCLHIRPMICLHDERDRATMQLIAREVTELVIAFGGALSGEHGDGRARSHLLKQFYGPTICAAFGAIKAIFDPQNLMNPGNIVSPVSMIESLRTRPRERDVVIRPVKTFFRYDREGGFAEAVHRCNGAGVCRKTTGGTMCPSYRALLDERHSTRGRGNALRLAITGQFSPGGDGPAWDDPETIRTLDLCLGCKACKAECPSNVDIAKLKAEYTAQRFKAAGRTPFQTRLVGQLRRHYRLGSALHPLSTWVGQFAPTAGLLKRLVGIDRRRALPVFGRSLYRWRESASRRRASSAAPTVLLLADCFSVYGEPRIGQAAVQVLESLGYQVAIPRMGCCGRPLISNGMLAEAVNECRRTATVLLEAVDRLQASAVVVCEPSCISAIVDDWQDLDIQIEPARLDWLARRTYLIEDFVESKWAGHPVQPALDRLAAGPSREPVLLHGHCHAKALWGGDSSAAFLRRVLGERLRVIDAGCCGMAGAFGYTADHYDLSMAIGELALFPAIRAAPGATIVAPGTSCRQQILDGTRRQAVHPIELIASMMKGGRGSGKRKTSNPEP